MMVSIEKPKSAIISVNDASLVITYGKINTAHIDYHDDLQWSFDDGNCLLRVSGLKIKRVCVTERFTNNPDDFNSIEINGKEYTFDEFIELIREDQRTSNRTQTGMLIIKEYFRKKFLWNEKQRYKYIHNGRDYTIHGINIVMKKDLWDKADYTATNFLMKEI